MLNGDALHALAAFAELLQRPLMRGWIDGRDTEGEGLVEAVAAKLSASQCPLILVGAIDLAGAAAAVALARSLGAALDHAAPCDLSAFQTRGMLATSPGEALMRADMLLLLGDLNLGMNDGWMSNWIARLEGANAAIRLIAADDDKGSRLHRELGLLRAAINGRKFVADDGERAQRANVAARLKKARYGVAVWRDGALPPLALDSALGLIDELSSATRWTGLPFCAPRGNAELTRMCLALTGCPPPLRFAAASSRAIHDPWRFSAANMLSRGEADAVLWLAADAASEPPFTGRALLVLTPGESCIPKAAAQIEIGVPGIEHDAILACERSGAFVRRAAARQGRTDVASLLQAIAARVAQATDCAA